MKKKRIIPLALVCALVLTLCIPQVNAFAMDVLSNFRVAEAKTITITLDDISQMSAYAQQQAAEFDGAEDSWDTEDFDAMDVQDHAETVPQPLESISDFTAFSAGLPESLDSETMELYALEQQERTFTLEDGSEVTVASSPMLLAKYDNAVFMATQGFSDNLTAQQKADLKEKLISLPFLTDNIRSQLQEIDPGTKDIYLPVVPGVSREASIGGTTGYLYGMNELRGVAGALPEGFSEELEDADTEELENVNLLIWTKDGVLYMLCGDMPESELIAAAGSVR